MKILLLALVANLTSSCASRTFQTDSIVHSKLGIPSSHRINDVPFMMVRRHNTFQADIISATRRQGMMALPIKSMENLLKELAAGNPVLVFQNLGLKKIPKWQYAVATGYNLKRQDIFLHTGTDKNLKTDMRLFEHTWALSDFWGLVILPPGQLSKTASEFDHMQAAIGLEQLEKFNEVEKAYLSILERWPDSLSALIGLGNIRYSQSRYSEAVIYLTAATIKHPASSTAWHNLALAQGSARMHKEAMKSSLKAISLVEPQKLESFKENLKEYFH